MRSVLTSASVPAMPRCFSCETRQLCTDDSPWSVAWWQVVAGSIARPFSGAVSAGGAVAVLLPKTGTISRRSGKSIRITCFLLSLSASLAPESVSRRHPVVVISPIPGIPRIRGVHRPSRPCVDSPSRPNAGRGRRGTVLQGRPADSGGRREPHRRGHPAAQARGGHRRGPPGLATARIRHPAR